MRLRRLTSGWLCHGTSKCSEKFVGRLWRPICRMSRNPSVVSIPQSEPLCSMVMFVAVVVPWTMVSTSDGSIPAWSQMPLTPCTTPKPRLTAVMPANTPVSTGSSPSSSTGPGRDSDPHDRYPDDLYLRQAIDDEARSRSDPPRDGNADSNAQTWAIAFGVMLIVGLVLYGISQPQHEGQTAATPPAGTETTGAVSPGSLGERPAPQQDKPDANNSARQDENKTGGNETGTNQTGTK